MGDAMLNSHWCISEALVIAAVCFWGIIRKHYMTIKQKEMLIRKDNKFGRESYTICENR